MIRWCISCSRFLGEVAPLDDYRTTFGTCSRCYEDLIARRKLDISENRVKSFESLYAQIKQVAASRNLFLVSEIIEKGKGLGFSPIDILLKVIQPALYEVGKRWESGEMSISQEHEFTAFCEGVFQWVYTSTQIDPALRHSEHPAVLLVNAPNNFHHLGIRMVELWLVSKGISCTLVYPGVPLSEIVELSRRMKPSVLGVSVTLSDQMSALSRLEQQLTQVLRATPLSIVVGGYAVKVGLIQKSTLPSVKLISDLDRFLVEVLIATSLQNTAKSKAG